MDWYETVSMSFLWQWFCTRDEMERSKLNMGLDNVNGIVEVLEIQVLSAI